jgi:hypothetical protein
MITGSSMRAEVGSAVRVINAAPKVRRSRLRNIITLQEGTVRVEVRNNFKQRMIILIMSHLPDLNGRAARTDLMNEPCIARNPTNSCNYFY